MEQKSKVYLYHTAARWTEQRKGSISCAGKPMCRWLPHLSSKAMRAFGLQRISSWHLPTSA